jgi:hypothetical protein
MIKRMDKWIAGLAGIAGGMLSLAGVTRAAPPAETSETNSATGQTRTQLVHASGIGGITGGELTMTAEVVSVDPGANTGTFKGPKGNLRTVYVSNAANQAKLATLKPSQVLQFNYTEAVATSLAPSSK